METKICKCCGRNLPLDAFHRDRVLKDGHRNICKSCACKRSKECDKRLNEKSNGLRSVYYSIRKRCLDKNHVSYKAYGGRGIVICDEWLSNPESFYAWAMSHGYTKGLQIDRIDTNGNYCPENCRFVTHAKNQHNKRNNRLDEQTVFGIRARYVAGMPQHKINDWLATLPCGRLNNGDLSRICRGKTWQL